MRLRSFHGNSLTDAMRQVRDTLGENAIIVATRDDESGGVRVTAAIDETPLAKPATTLGEAPNPALKHEEKDGSEVIEIIATALMRHQVPTSLAERLLATATQFANDDPVLSLGAAFDTHLQFLPLSDDKASKPQILIGMPGAGKTLTTAKLATKATLAKKPVMVISTDTERAGGMEQLAAFTRLLKVELMEIEDAHALKDAIGMNKTDTLTLIDTPGRNPFSSAERQLLQPLITACGGEVSLVIPADLDANAAIEMVQEFKSFGVTRLIFTRLDMTRRLGSLLRIAFETRLPLANFSISGKVTEAPLAFNPITLAKLVLPQQVKAEAQATGTHNKH